MTTLAWLIGCCWLGYCAGRLVAAYKYGGWIDRVNRRNAYLEHWRDNMLDWHNGEPIQLTMFRRNCRIRDHA